MKTIENLLSQTRYCFRRSRQHVACAAAARPTVSYLGIMPCRRCLIIFSAWNIILSG